MGSKFKEGMFNEHLEQLLRIWSSGATNATPIARIVKESYQSIQIEEQEMMSTAGETTKSIIEVSCVLDQTHEPST